jgi:hypothetical protein
MVLNQFTNLVTLTRLIRRIFFEPTSVFLIQHQVPEPVGEIIASVSDESEANDSHDLKQPDTPDMIECRVNVPI